MFCTNCGSKIADGARFCSECGAKVEESGVRDFGTLQLDEAATSEIINNDTAGTDKCIQAECFV